MCWFQCAVQWLHNRGALPHGNRVGVVKRQGWHMSCSCRQLRTSCGCTDNQGSKGFWGLPLKGELVQTLGSLFSPVSWLPPGAGVPGPQALRSQWFENVSGTPPGLSWNTVFARPGRGKGSCVAVKSGYVAVWLSLPCLGILSGSSQSSAHSSWQQLVFPL